MHNIIENILWNTGVLKSQLFNVEFQWVKAHDDTFGNEIDDLLAKKGRELTEEKGRVAKVYVK